GRLSERGLGGVLSRKGDPLGPVALQCRDQPRDVEPVLPDLEIGSRARLAEVGEADSVLADPGIFVGAQHAWRQPDLVQRLPEGVAGPRVVRPDLGGLLSERGSAEDDPEAGPQNVGNEHAADFADRTGSLPSVGWQLTQKRP